MYCKCLYRGLNNALAMTNMVVILYVISECAACTCSKKMVIVVMHCALWWYSVFWHTEREIFYCSFLSFFILKCLAHCGLVGWHSMAHCCVVTNTILLRGSGTSLASLSEEMLELCWSSFLSTTLTAWWTNIKENQFSGHDWKALPTLLV